MSIFFAGSVALIAEIPATAAPPDFVLVLTDDQRWDTLWSMPRTRELLVHHGVKFQNGFVVNPTCCPSRASLLTGQYSHSTGLYGNGGPHGGFDNFNDSSTLSTWLDASGYETALIGKYLNGYNDPSYIPPGWDRWFASVSGDSGSYYDYDVSDQGDRSHFGDEPDDYATDVLATEAEDFISGVPPSDPLFLYFSPSAPHQPATPANRHKGEFSELGRWRPPSYNERNVRDKPSYVRHLGRLSKSERRTLDNLRRRQYASLQAVDDAVARIVDALRETNRLGTTMIVLTSDNGFMWGEHRLGGKGVPYNESIRVPFAVRYDPLTQSGGRNEDLVLNIDIAPTIAALAGAASAPTDGRSFAGLLDGSVGNWRDDFLVEHLDTAGGGRPPTYCALRRKRFLYVRYRSGNEELYSHRADPFELHNRADDRASRPRLRSLRRRARRLCDPPPPGYSW